jgi:hypothetical protein
MKGNALLLFRQFFSFRCYLYGSPFALVTNHQLLKFLMESNQLTRKLVKWALIFQEYDFDIVHKVGRDNWDANGLSWNPNFN